MKDLIIQALTNAFVKLEKMVPQTRVEIKQVSISDVSPLDIVNFMKDNNIPDNAYFGGRDNGYDAFDDICLCWGIDTPTTDKEKTRFKRDKFSTIAFKPVYDILTTNGYKRVGFNTGLLAEFKDTTVYDMFINKDYDRLVKYYSLPFIQK